MRHDASIPLDLHTEMRDSLRGAMGTFWSTIFSDRDLIDATLTARVLSASQLYIDVMEALSLRDHNGLPIFHREHWQPMLIRLSQRNTGSGLRVSMDDKTVIGPQTQATNPGHVYLEGEQFKVGANSDLSKVYTYPFTASACPLVGVATCICDSITQPDHTIFQNRDFFIRDGVLTVRKEQDPFTVGGYRVIDDGDDKIAVLWLCDAALDTNNVGDFLSYPLGLDVPTTEAAAKMLSALWDVVIYGLTPMCLGMTLGALFGIPTVPGDTTVESVSEEDDDGMVTVATADSVYRIEKTKLSPAVTAGASLRKGTMLTNEITVYRGLSQDEVMGLISGSLTNLALPVGSVLGVSETVVLENIDSPLEDGGWFKLSACDSVESPFWTAVCSRTTEDERISLFNSLVNGGTEEEPTVNPLKALGYVALANLVLVTTTRPLGPDASAGIVLEYLVRLVPAYAAILIVQFIAASESFAVPADDATVVNNVETQNENVSEAEDDVVITFVPCAETEV